MLLLNANATLRKHTSNITDKLPFYDSFQTSLVLQALCWALQLPLTSHQKSLGVRTNATIWSPGCQQCKCYSFIKFGSNNLYQLYVTTTNRSTAGMTHQKISKLFYWIKQTYFKCQHTIWYADNAEDGIPQGYIAYRDKSLHTPLCTFLCKEYSGKVAIPPQDAPGAGLHHINMRRGAAWY